MSRVLKKPSRTLLKRPAGLPCTLVSRKRPASAIAETVTNMLAKRAPAYLPSKRPRPGKLCDDETKEPPKARRMSVSNSSFKQVSLNGLMLRAQPLLYLHLRGAGVNKPEALSFKVSGFALPELTHLVVENWPLKTGIFEQRAFPKLRSLQISFPFDGEPDTPDDWATFKLDLPELRELVLERPGTVKPAELKASTQACPKLKYFCLYKVYVETLSVVLPNAQHVWLHRMEFLKSVSVYGPCLRELRLQACYDLRRVNILQRALGVEPVADSMSKFVVDLTNSCLGQQAIEDIREHPRVKYVVLPSDDDSMTEDEEEVQSHGGYVFKIGHFMKAPGMNTMQRESFLGLTSFGEQMGVNVYERVQEAKSVTEKQMARMLAWGARVIYIWFQVTVPDECLELARRLRVPLRFWDDVTEKRTKRRNAIPIICWGDDMRKMIKKGCT